MIMTPKTTLAHLGVGLLICSIPKLVSCFFGSREVIGGY
jgi:hypothetical protein